MPDVLTQNLVPFQPGHEFGNGGRREYPLTEAVELQKLCMKLARAPKVRPLDLAALARAWDVLEERKRILRGKPLPGQLRPDLDPAMNAKRGKRGKAILEIAMMPAETPDPSSPAPSKSTKPTTTIPTTARDVLDAAEELVKQVGDGDTKELDTSAQIPPNTPH